MVLINLAGSGVGGPVKISAYNVGQDAYLRTVSRDPPASRAEV